MYQIALPGTQRQLCGEATLDTFGRPAKRNWDSSQEHTHWQSG
jgi:hypothetical protein